MKKFIAIISALSLAAGLTVGASALTYRGDVNGDGKVNSNDALMILKHSVGIEQTEFNSDAADINKDGTINSSDALLALKISVGLDEPEVIPSEQSEILEYYNNAIDRTYAVAKTVNNTVYEEYNLFYGDDGLSDTFGPMTFTGYFENGVDEYGFTPYDMAPNSQLTTDMINSISMEKNGDETVIELNIKSEKVDIFDDSVYQAAGGMPFYYTNDESLDYQYVWGTIYYRYTTVKAVIDKDGYVTFFDVTVMYESEYCVELKDYEDSQGVYNEEGVNRYNIEIIR